MLLLAAGSLCPPFALAHVPPPPVYEIRIRALLDGDQVVRPPEYQPPELGSGSAATGELDLVLSPGIDPLGLDNRFSLDLTVRGISVDQLDTSQTDNETAVHIHQGGPRSTGPMLIDAHYYALDDSSAANGITPTEDGFRLHAEGLIAEEQGDLAEGFAVLEIVDLLRSEDAYIVVRTRTDPLFGEGEIRGSLRVVPERIRLTAMLDEGKVVRPPEFRPPELGTGSPAIGEATLAINTFTSRFSFDLAVEGIDGAKLDDAHGQNRTAIQIRGGAPGATGDILLDVHHFSRLDRPDTNGISPAPGGFELHAEGSITQVQGDHDTGVAVARIIDFLRTGAAYVDVRTTAEPLYAGGEIRGNLQVVPNEFHLRARLDGRQVVRPFQFRPPDFGTGSTAAGEMNLFVERNTGKFRCELDVDGIDPASFHADNRNRTSVHVHWGTPDLQGPVLIDLQHFARARLPDSDGVEKTPDGFSLTAEGAIVRFQGRHFTTFTLDQIIDFLTSAQSYVSVETKTEPLFEQGEIRGNIELVQQEEKLELRAHLDGSQVVRPPELRPPTLGSGSTSVGEAILSVDVKTGGFTFDLEVEGIDPLDLDNSQGEHGANHSAIHIYRGGPDVRGPIILDVHYFARILLATTDGITATGNGFRMRATGTIRRAQGAHDIGAAGIDVIEAFRWEEAYVEVHTSTSPVFVAGEIRGNLKLVTARSSPQFQRGDANSNGRVDLTDAVMILGFLFSGSEAPPCLKSADVDDDGAVGLTDPLGVLNFLFLNGRPPAAPFGACGSDPTPDELDCAGFAPCAG